MSVALLFPGQGSQSQAMLPWLEASAAAAPVLDAMQAIVGRDWRRRSAEPAWLAQNQVAQCLLTGINIAAWRALVDAGLPEPAAVAGYSVGELSAFCAAGVFEFEEALRLSVLRAQGMDRSATTPGCLLSSTGRPLAELSAAMQRWRFSTAIAIAPDKFVLGGPRESLAGMDEALKALGVSTTLLPISVASHTGAMEQASAEFAKVIAQAPWRTPNLPLVTNFSGSRVLRETALKECLAQQISHTVQWEKALKTLGERGPRCALEIGPGTALSRQWLQAHPTIPVRSADEFNSAASVVAWVGNACS